MRKVKLITETNWDGLEIKESQENKRLYIMGKFSSAESLNNNGRIYPKPILEREIKKLIAGPIKEKTCVGQMGHPEDTPETDLEKAAILIEDLKWKGNDVYGKAKVLKTPSGKILTELINDGVKLGISSRALGTVDSNGNVNEDLNILCWDVVSSPSNKGSWVNGILENKEFTVNDDSITITTEEKTIALKEYIKETKSIISSIINSI